MRQVLLGLVGNIVIKNAMKEKEKSLKNLPYLYGKTNKSHVDMNSMTWVMSYKFEGALSTASSAWRSLHVKHAQSFPDMHDTWNKKHA